jgi:hypothetical protein
MFQLLYSGLSILLQAGLISIVQYSCILTYIPAGERQYFLSLVIMVHAVYRCRYQSEISQHNFFKTSLICN